MNYEIVNKYADAQILQQKVSDKPFKSDELCSFLRTGTEQVFPRKDFKNTHNQTLTFINQFAQFLNECGEGTVVPNEYVLENFRSWLETSCNNSGSQASKSVDYVRRICNDFMFPRGFILRKLLVRKAFLKYHSFLSLSKTTQESITQYEKDGRCVDTGKKYFEDSKGRESFKYKVKRKAKKISAYNRKRRIDSVRTVLTVLNKTGIEQLDKNDLERLIDIYQKKNRKEIAKDYLAALFSIIANGIDLGSLSKNPFDNFVMEKRSNKKRHDFIMPDQMDKILDLESINWNDPADVRMRCLVVLLYDTGLRVSSSAMLSLNDVFELGDSTYRLSVKGEYLKGDKEEKIFYMLFEQTIVLLRHWLHVSRPKLNPKTNHLFTSLDGMPLTRTGIKNIVHACCHKLNVKTFKGSLPSPHTFRHTLPTLNTAPFGKCVAPRLMQQRLGHSSFEIFERVYVHSNPLAEMKEYKKLYARDIKGNSLTNISKEDFFQVLDSLSYAKESVISQVKDAYERQLSNNLSKVSKWEQSMTESHAVSALNGFKIGHRGLRRWALREGLCRIVERNGQKEYLYEKEWILNLTENYIAFQEAQKLYHGSETSFYRIIKQYRKFKMAGKILIWKNDFLESIVPTNKAVEKSEKAREKYMLSVAESLK